MDSQRGGESAIELYKDPEFGTRISNIISLDYDDSQQLLRSSIMFDVYLKLNPTSHERGYVLHLSVGLAI